MVSSIILAIGLCSQSGWWMDESEGWRCEMVNWCAVNVCGWQSKSSGSHRLSDEPDSSIFLMITKFRDKFRDGIVPIPP